MLRGHLRSLMPRRRVATRTATAAYDALPVPADRADWHLLTLLIGLTTVTGRLAGEQPESLLIVGASGAGKSALLNRYCSLASDAINPHIVRLTNLSSMGLQRILENDVPRGVTHVIVPEMQTLMLRQRGVWDNLVGLLLPALEEGVYDTAVGPHLKSFGGARIGLIGAITQTAYRSNYNALRESGLLSRMLPVLWERQRENILWSQLRHNAGDNSEMESIHVHLTGSRNVTITRAALDDVARYAHDIEPGNVFRAARRFRALAKALAYVNGDSEATEDHTRALRAFAQFWKGV